MLEEKSYANIVIKRSPGQIDVTTVRNATGKLLKLLEKYKIDPKCASFSTFFGLHVHGGLIELKLSLS